MLLYFPWGVCSDELEIRACNGCETLDECKEIFNYWENFDDFRIKELWVDVKDTENPKYKKRIKVKRDYIFEEETS